MAKYFLTVSILFCFIWADSFSLSTSFSTEKPFYSIEDTILTYDTIMPYHVIINSMYLLQGTNYIVSNNDTSIQYQTGSKNIFYLKNIHNNNTINVVMPLSSNSILDSSAYRVCFDIDSSKIIQNVRVKIYTDSSDLIIPMDSLFFSVLDSNELIIYIEPNPYAWHLKDDTTKLRVVLEDGLSLSPNGDGFYEELNVLGLDSTDVYQLSIYDANKALLFSTSDKTAKWNCYYENTDILVPVGTYIYNILADTDSLQGQFFVKY